MCRNLPLSLRPPLAVPVVPSSRTESLARDMPSAPTGRACSSSRPAQQQLASDRARACISGEGVRRDRSSRVPSGHRCQRRRQAPWYMYVLRRLTAPSQSHRYSAVRGRAAWARDSAHSKVTLTIKEEHAGRVSVTVTMPYTLRATRSAGGRDHLLDKRVLTVGPIASAALLHTTTQVTTLKSPCLLLVAPASTLLVLTQANSHPHSQILNMQRRRVVLENICIVCGNTHQDGPLRAAHRCSETLMLLVGCPRRPRAHQSV